MPKILTLILFADTDVRLPSNMILMIMKLLAAMYEKQYIVNLLLNIRQDAPSVSLVL